MLLQFLVAAALAADFYVETPDGTDRTAADASETHATAAGFDARVVRRFVDGAGWRFFVRVEGFVDEPSATIAASQLASRAHAPFAVFRADGDHAVRLAVVSGDRPPAGVAAEPVPAAPVLYEVLNAHGTSATTLERIRTGPLKLVYRRALPGDRVVETTWLARGGEVRVDVEPVRGNVHASTTVFGEQGAWLSVDGSAFERQDLEKSKAVVGQLAPEEVLPLVLALGSAVPSRREFERMSVVGEREDADGEPLVVLRFEGDATAGPVELAVSAEDHLVRVARFGDAGGVEHRFSDYRSVGDLTVPYRVTTTREGEATDVVDVVEIDLQPTIPTGAFDAG